MLRALPLLAFALFIGAFGIYIACTSSGGGGGDDDDDDDNDTASEECDAFCDYMANCLDLADQLGIQSVDQCVDLCEQSDSSVVECVMDASSCDDLATCLAGEIEVEVTLSCESISKAVNLTWSINADDVQRYYIFRSEPGEDNFAQVATTVGNLQNYEDKFLSEAVYDYSVSAEYYPPGKTTLELTDMSNVVTCTSIISAPRDFDAKNNHSLADDFFDVYLTWIDSTTAENRYELYRKKNNQWDSDYQLVAELSPNTTRYCDPIQPYSDQISEDYYYYRIYACNEAGCSDYDEVSTSPDIWPHLDQCQF